MKKSLLLILLTVILASSLLLVACDLSGLMPPNEWGTVFTLETAYAQAQELGYTGSLTEFLASIRGQDGVNGADGIGIKSVTVNEQGNLIVTLTDDTVVDCGNVKGEQGPSGLSITKAEINDNGELIITFSDDTTQNVGVVVGANGQQGLAGITPQLKIGEDNYWYVSYDSGKTWIPFDVKASGESGGQGPTGPQGDIGVSIVDTILDANGNMVITYSDGTTQVVEHTWEKLYTLEEATCVKEGKDLYSCTHCSLVRVVIVELTEHTLGIAVEENKTDATCLTAGSYDSVVYCSVCDKELSRENLEILAIGHKLEVVPGKSPTCTEPGLESGIKCSNCGEIQLEQEVILALGHTDSESVKENIILPTCTKTGSYDSVVYCSVCNEEVSRETITTTERGHTWTNGECSVCKEFCAHNFDANNICTICGYSGFAVPTEGYNGEPVTITFYHTMGTNLNTVLDMYIDEFNILYPNITIEWQQVGGYDDVRDQIQTELTVGGGPNIAYCYPDHVALYNVAQAVTTLDNLIDSDVEVTRADGTKEIVGLTQAQKDDFIAGFYNEGRAFGDGLMYTMPFSKTTEVLYYNKTFFDANGLQLPTHWWCTEDCGANCTTSLEYVCAKIKEIDPNSIPLGYDSESNWFITMCEQLGTPYTSASGEKFLFDNDANKEFIKRFREWHKKDWLTTQEIYGAYTSGLFINQDASLPRSYMSIGSSAGATHQRPAALEDGSYPFEVGIASIPQVDPANPKVISQGPSVCIFQKSNPQEVVASWLFVKYLTTSVEFQAAFGLASGYIPVLKSVRDESLAVYNDKGEPENAIAIYIENLKKADGGTNIAQLSIQVALDQESAYYVSPAFNGSSAARDQVGMLIENVFLLTKTGADLDAEIDKLFANAVSDCYKAIGESVPSVTEGLTSAREYLDSLYLNTNEETANDFSVTTVVTIADVQYNVSWEIISGVAGQTAAVLGEVGSDKQQLVNVDEFSAAEVAYKLVGTISDAEGHSVVVEYGRKVPMFATATWEEYVTACEANDRETVINVKGYVTAVNADPGSSSKGSLWVRDAEGHGYYAYKPALDASITASRESILATFPVGAEVVISGTVGNKYGNQHNAGCTVKLTGNTAPEGWNAVVDLTEAFSNAENSQDASLDAYYGSMATLKNVTMGQIDGYNYHFTINGKDYIFYMNIYLMDKEANEATAAKWVVGGKANLTGLVITYSKKYQIYPYGPECIEVI